MITLGTVIVRPRTTRAGCRLRGRNRTEKVDRQGSNGEGQGRNYALHCFLLFGCCRHLRVAVRNECLPYQRSPGHAAEFRRLHSLVVVAAEKVQRRPRVAALQLRQIRAEQGGRHGPSGCPDTASPRHEGSSKRRSSASRSDFRRARMVPSIAGPPFRRRKSSFSPPR